MRSLRSSYAWASIYQKLRLAVNFFLAFGLDLTWDEICCQVFGNWNRNRG